VRSATRTAHEHDRGEHRPIIGHRRPTTLRPRREHRNQRLHDLPRRRAPARRGYLADHNIPDLTPRTVTDRRVLLRQLEAVEGYALDREEYALGTACVAASVPSPSLVAAVAVSVRAHQVRRIIERSDALHRAARLIAYAGAV
jgi:Bacterial transcriptional regulator